MTDRKHPPRGYIHREDWVKAEQRCDIGDGMKQVLCHFYPHREYQLPEMFAVMSVEEHQAIIADKEKEIEALRERLANMWVDAESHARGTGYISVFCEIAKQKAKQAREDDYDGN
jgi:hypothetical protein